MERTKKKEPEMIRKKKITVKVNDFVSDIKLWVHFTEQELSLAKTSHIDTNNGPYFKSLVRDYKRGLYDKDMNLLGDAIKQMLKNTASYNKM